MWPLQNTKLDHSASSKYPQPTAPFARPDGGGLPTASGTPVRRCDIRKGTRKKGVDGLLRVGFP